MDMAKCFIYDKWIILPSGRFIKWISYNGEWENGMFHGQGELIYVELNDFSNSVNLKYKGSFQFGIPNGHGNFYHNYSLLFTGNNS